MLEAIGDLESQRDQLETKYFEVVKACEDISDEDLLTLDENILDLMIS